MNGFPSALELLQFALDHKAYFFWLANFVLIFAAFAKGAGPEKAIASVLTVTFLASQIYREWSGIGFALTGIDLWSLVMDFLLAASFVAIALHANRMYPLWMAGLQLICLMAHLARAVAPDVDLLAYAILVMAPSYIQLLVFALGMLAHRRRQKAYGSYRSWRSSSFLSRTSGQRS